MVASTGENPEIFRVESGPPLLERRAGGEVVALVEAWRAYDMTVANTRHGERMPGRPRSNTPQTARLLPMRSKKDMADRVV